MKLIAIIMLFMSASAFSSISLKSQCHKVGDSIDRDYCHKKKMKLVRNKFENDKKTWKKELSSKVKAAKLKNVSRSISEKAALIKMLKDELNLMNSYKSSLAKARPVKKKKKKKKKKNDLERLFNIKL